MSFFCQYSSNDRRHDLPSMLATGAAARILSSRIEEISPEEAFAPHWTEELEQIRNYLVTTQQLQTSKWPPVLWILIQIGSGYYAALWIQTRILTSDADLDMWIRIRMERYKSGQITEYPVI